MSRLDYEGIYNTKRPCALSIEGVMESTTTPLHPEGMVLCVILLFPRLEKGGLVDVGLRSSGSAEAEAGFSKRLTPGTAFHCACCCGNFPSSSLPNGYHVARDCSLRFP